MKLKRFLINPITERFAPYVALAGVILIFLETLQRAVVYYPEYSSLPAGLAKAALAVATLSFVDEVILGRINTYEKMKENSLGYAIIFFAFAFVIGMAFSAT